MRQLLLAIVLAGCNSERLTSNGAIARTSSAKADVSAAPVHSITGSGYSKPGPGLEFSTTLAIHQDATGRVWGRIVSRIIDLSAFGPFTKGGELIQEPVCIRVVGNTAWISMITVKTYDDNVSKVGDKGVYWVQDGGKGGVDVGYGGPAFFWDPTDAICTSTPPTLPAVPVDRGNFDVR